MSNLPPFTPAASASIDATDTTGNVALPPSGAQLLIYSPAANDAAFIAFGTASTVEAEVTDICIPPGFSRIFTIPDNTTYVAAICASTETATLYFTRGNGE